MGKQKIELIKRRDWRNYNKITLNNELRKIKRHTGYDSVQSCWNSFESNLITVIDKLIPLRETRNTISHQEYFMHYVDSVMAFSADEFRQ